MATELGRGDAVQFRTWPPSDLTRAKLVERMANNLASLSFFSQNYGRIHSQEAAQHAKRIEEAAFLAAQKEAEYNNSVFEDVEEQEGSLGTVLVQFYARHASTLMLETLKSTKSSVSDAIEEGVSEAKDLVPQQKREVVGAISEGKERSEAKNREVVFDISGGTRAFLSKEKAEELFAPLLEPESSTFTEVCLSNWS